MTLEAKIREKIQLRRERIDCLKREHGDFVISNVTVEQIYSGIRGVPIQVSDISYVDPEKGRKEALHSLHLLPLRLLTTDRKSVV